MSQARVRLWSDEPSPIDLLAFGAVGETAVEAVLDDTLDPIALGVSGPWGSGKSTVLQLIETQLADRGATEPNRRILVVRSDPWRYDPAVGAKATLISEVLGALAEELEHREKNSTTAEATKALGRLVRRVNWTKALTLAAKTSITLQIPSIDDLTGLVSREPDGDGPDAASKTLDDFREQFAELLSHEALRHVSRVVVLVDDLDRCLPDTVVETLETMRLFLAVPKMSFVIAADEDRVADALRERYPTRTAAEPGEEPARLYLHKIVQTTLRLPALSRFDTEAFLLLLLLQNRPDGAIGEATFGEILGRCGELRTKAGALDALVVPDGLDISAEMQFAARLTPMLYEKLRGSPRRVKRFLNDLNVRASIASRRGIELDIPIVAKLMILELLLPDEFSKVLDWIARGELRQQLSELERQAGRSRTDVSPGDDRTRDNDGGDDDSAPKTPRRALNAREQHTSEANDGFSENIIRWAKLPPQLGDIDLSPYLHLAASFGGTPLIDVGLPERLRDIAANLLSASRIEQKAVTDDDLRGLTTTDTTALLEHLGRMAQDRPGEMIRAVGSILRIAKTVPPAVASAEKALKALPAADIRPPVVLLFQGASASTFAAVLDGWLAHSSDQTTKNAIGTVLQKDRK